MTTIIAVSVIASFIIAAAIGPALIRYLHNMNFGQKILSYVPEHAGKQNTPTMGEVTIFAALKSAPASAAATLRRRL